MSKCDLCGQEAGFLRKRHKVCQEKYDEGITKIKAISTAGALGKQDLNSLKDNATQIAKQSLIPDKDISLLMIQGWEQAVWNALEDGVLSREEEDALDAYKQHFSFSQKDLDQNGAYIKVVKAGIIRDLLEGKLPERVKIDGPLPFNLQKGELPRWLFNGVPYYEERTRTTYSGGYQGVSVRVAKGVYYRTGGFRGNPVISQQKVHVATGVFAVTEKNLYFASVNKSLRIPYKKIVSFIPYSDGIGIQRDASSAKPQIFVTNDGWFTFNLIQNLAQMAAA